MDFINPFGRKVGDGVQPQACMCSNSYSSAKNPDSCSHCGCDCDPQKYSNGNSKTARNAGRVSFA